VSAASYRLGLTGYPLEHSFSPQLHTAALKACGLQGEYRLYPVTLGDIAGLMELLQRVRSGVLHGLNVTIPYKQSVLPLLDEVTETARRIGAVNTICLRDGALLGENTDAAGFLADLRGWLSAQRQEHGGIQSALVLGAGGSARAVVYALHSAGWQVCAAARRLEQAQALRWAIASEAEALELSGEAMAALAADRRLDLVVNTTPLGMGALVAESPWPQGVPLPGMAFVYDLVYNPPETALLRAARDAGLKCANGLGMLIEQARLAFKLWTGCEVRREVMEQAMLKIITTESQRTQS
jgi:shikimate dehydrogenase